MKTKEIAELYREARDNPLLKEHVLSRETVMALCDHALAAGLAVGSLDRHEVADAEAARLSRRDDVALVRRIAAIERRLDKNESMIAELGTIREKTGELYRKILASLENDH